MMLNFRLGYTPQSLFTHNLENRSSLTQSLVNSLLTLLSIPNVVRGIMLLMTSLLVAVYLFYLWIMAGRERKVEPIVNQQLVRVTRLQGNGQVRTQIN